MRDVRSHDRRIVSEQAAKPRVLILATRVPLQSGDGTPSFVLDNAFALAAEFDITILAPRVQGSSRTTTHEGITVRRFAYFPRSFESLADDAIMPQLTRQPALWVQAISLVVCMILQTLVQHVRHRPDLIHAQWILPSALVAYLTRPITRTPYIITSHGADAFRLNSGPLQAVKSAVINGSTRFIGVSRDVSEQFIGARTPLEVQPTGVDFALWQRLVGERTPEDGRVLFVGRLATKKGIADAIRAISCLERAELRIIGDGPLSDELQELAEASGVSDRVVFLGRRTRGEIAIELKSAACLVIPSIAAPDGDRDGTPNVLGEAIAASVPVVASRIAGLADYVHHGTTGLLHEPGDVQGLRDCLRQVIRSPELGVSFARDALARFKDPLDVKNVAARYGGWYRAAASGPR